MTAATGRMHRSSTRLRSVLAIAVAGALATASMALAAGPIKGRTYTGTLAHGPVRIVLKVAKSGRSVLVSAPYAPIYCGPGAAGGRGLTHAVAISARGKFSATITYELKTGHVKLSTLSITGRFSGPKVTGTGRTEFLPAVLAHCDGSTTFSAKAKKK